MSVRVQRLYADYIRLREVLKNHQHIKIAKVIGNPPDQYEIEYNVKGLREEGNKIVEVRSHRARIKLPRAYPSLAAECVMLTPVFHPNISPQTICTMDHSSQVEALPDLIVRIGQMLCYQTYNVKSPRNGEAAKWASENLNRFPIDGVNLMPAVRPEDVEVRLADIEALAQQDLSQVSTVAPEGAPVAVGTAGAAVPGISSTAAEKCANCGSPVTAGLAVRCTQGHRVCRDCAMVCPSCRGVNCVLCDLQKCADCGDLVCRRCIGKCAECGRQMCRRHRASCAACGLVVCASCGNSCAQCSKTYCRNHVDAAQKICLACAQAPPAVLRITTDEVASPSVVPSPAQLQDRSCGKCGRTGLAPTARFCPSCGLGLV